jgi:hypothetical protein
MATSAATFPDSQRFERARTAESSIPWSIYAVLFASTSVILGVIWDISWHRSIRTRYVLTPAHLGIYLGECGCGPDLRLGRAGPRSPDRDADRGTAVRFWGIPRAARRVGLYLGRLRDGHLGAFRRLVAQRGLDVKIISPPHMLLAAGIAAIQCGAMLMALAWQNRAIGDRRRLGNLYPLGAGLLRCSSPRSRPSTRSAGTCT